MRLIDNWRVVALRAYSVHCFVATFASILVCALGDAWPLFAGLLPLLPLAFAVLGLFFSALGGYLRMVKQPNVSGGK